MLSTSKNEEVTQKCCVFDVVEEAVACKPPGQTDSDRACVFSDRVGAIRKTGYMQ